MFVLLSWHRVHHGVPLVASLVFALGGVVDGVATGTTPVKVGYSARSLVMMAMLTVSPAGVVLNALAPSSVDGACLRCLGIGI